MLIDIRHPTYWKHDVSSNLNYKNMFWSKKKKETPQPDEVVEITKEINTVIEI